MPESPIQLPSTVAALQAMVAQQLVEKAEQQARLAELEHENKRQSARIFTLQEQLNLALARRYAASSEKLSPDQIRLFNEAEIDAQTAPVEDDTEDAIDVPAHTRKKRGRKPLPDALPRTEVIHELTGDDLSCPHDGQMLKVIGEVASEQLDIVPATIRVIRHVRRQYACDCGQQ